MHHIKAKLVIKQKIMQTIIKFTWDSSMMMNKQIYFVMTRSLLSHEVIIWYTSQRMKDYQKSLNIKLKSVQERALWQIINIYHATSTFIMQHQHLSCNINRDFTDENKHDVNKYSLTKADTKIDNKHELLKIERSYQDNNASNS